MDDEFGNASRLQESLDRPVLLSIRPRFAELLIRGLKTAEIRRRFPSSIVGRELFIYSTSPQKVVVGVVLAVRIESVHPEVAWEQFGERLRIERDELDSYLSGVKQALVISTSVAERFERPVPAHELHATLGIRASQNFRYLDALQAARLRALGASARTISR